MKKVFYFIAIFIMASSLQLPDNEAKLKMINKSKRFLTVKIMKGSERKSELYSEATLSPKSTHIFSFTETGKYYVKSMAVLTPGKGDSNDTIYMMGKPFQVIADPKKGYTQMKMKFTIKESKKPTATGTIPISRSKFLKN